MSDKRLIALEKEIAHLGRELREFIDTRPVEIHYHYYYDRDNIKEVLDYFKNQFGKH